MYRILILEDDFALAQAMKEQIQPWGHEVKLVEDFQDVMPAFLDYDPHLVLVDIMLPFFNGYHWCSEIRKVSNVPIVFLSSASDDMNIVMAMNMGGDDFIAKPVDPNVMNAKLQAILRRAYDMPSPPPTLTCRGAVLDLGDGTLHYQGQTLDLTKNERRILQTLMEQKGKIVSRDALMVKLWQDDCYVEENTLTVNVARLRKKLEGAGLYDFITTKIGSGYLLAEE
jgi:DNA-binding response OmpR family regulator